MSVLGVILLGVSVLALQVFRKLQTILKRYGNGTSDRVHTPPEGRRVSSIHCACADWRSSIHCACVIGVVSTVPVLIGRSQTFGLILVHKFECLITTGTSLSLC